MSIILMILLLLFYVTPFVLINLNTVMSSINYIRNGKEIKYGYSFLFTLLSFVPVINVILAYIFTPIESRDVFLPNFLKGLNDALECNSCGIIMRRHNLKDFSPHKYGYSDYDFDSRHICPYCENSSYMSERTSLRNKKLPFGKKITPIGGVFKFFTLGLNENERKLRALEKQQKDLEFADKQIEKWQKLQDEKLKRMERKVEELKKEMC